MQQLSMGDRVGVGSINDAFALGNRNHMVRFAGGIAKYAWKNAKNNTDGPLSVSAHAFHDGQL